MSGAQLFGTALLVSVLAIVGASCASIPDPGRYTVVALPDLGQFSGGGANGLGVHAFLENQCGTLDCHGQLGRPFRLFSQNGLRADNDAGLVSGGGAVSPAEIYSNYLSAIGVEPEEMDRVVAGIDSPDRLLLVRKPRGEVFHKGGIRMAVGQPGDLCLTSWLADPSVFMGAHFDPTVCDMAGTLPF